MSKRHTIDEWTELFDIDVTDYPNDFEGSKLLQFNEFAEALGACGYVFLSREGLQKFLRFQG